MVEIIGRPAALHPADAFLAVDHRPAAAFIEATVRDRFQRVATEDVGFDAGGAAGFVDDVRRIAGLPELIVIGDVGRDGRDARHLAVLEDIAADMFGSQRTEAPEMRSEENTSELQSLMRTSYALVRLTKKK